MKKWLPYGIGFLLLAVVLLLLANRKPTKRKFDARITLRQTDAIPYGTRVTKEILPHLYPAAQIFTDKKEPGRWDSLDTEQSGQAVVLMGKFFNADDYELSTLLQFARKGNYVFIVAQSFSSDVSKFFRFTNSEYEVSEDLWIQDDSVETRLMGSVFDSTRLYSYPGKKFESYFTNTDSSITQTLGTTKKGWPNFLGFKAGDGYVFVHSSPLCFSNYFVLHKQNAGYAQQALSVIPPNVSKVLWNEYYLIKPTGVDEKKPDWFSVLMQFPAFKWALLTGMLALALYLLLGMRRRQNPIPAIAKPRNESLDFIKTLGRLYYDKRDHLNLARKMSSYFFEHIRSQYRLNTSQRDEAFIKSLHEKSGYEEKALKSLLGMIDFIETAPAISERQLAQFHQQLEHFYQNT